jgi:hypothetical protein
MHRFAPLLASVALLATAPAVPQAQPSRTGLVQAGQLLDRPGHAARGPSTIVIRDGRVVEVRSGHAGADLAEFAGA